MYYHTKNCKINIQYIPEMNNALIQIFDKHGCFWFSALSKNIDELNEDINDAQPYIPTKCGRKWFRENIKNIKNQLK